MNRLRLGLGSLALMLLVAGWYLFRPERAVLDVQVDERTPRGATQIVAAGRFEPRSHEGRGDAQILRNADGHLIVRLSNFATLNGPDVRVYLAGTDVRKEKDLEATGFLDLGELKGNIGDQNYDIPDGTDLSRYRAVIVWCRRFGVNFTTAALTPARAPAGT